jgi:hypothetical protein
MGKYCPEGTTEEILCPSGTFGTHEQLDAEEKCESCPPGYFCDAGVKDSVVSSFL